MTNKVNLGCGFNAAEGWMNVDVRLLPGVHLVCDLSCDEWNIKDNWADEVWCAHVLEHIQNTQHFMKQLYRICKDGAAITIIVPHPRSDSFLDDPTHVRPIMPKTINLFNQEMNIFDRDQKTGVSTLGLDNKVNFAVKEVTMNIREDWKASWDKADAKYRQHLLNTHYNVADAIRIEAVKLPLLEQ